MVLVNAFGRLELVTILLRYLAGMSAIVRSVELYSMCCIFVALSELSAGRFEAIALRLWDTIIDVF